MAEVVGVILAAGKGRRMYPLTQHVPKPMLPICNRPLVERHIEMLRACGVRRVILVIGHLGEQFREALGSGRRLGVEIDYIQQPRPEGIAHALACLANRVTCTMVVILGDIYFVADDIRPAVTPVLFGDADATLLSKKVRKREEIKKNFEILVTSNGRVERVVEKPVEPSCDIKGCGLYVFNTRIFDAIARTPRSELRNEYELTDAIQVLVDDDAVVQHAPLIREDINLTSPSDLLSANLAELRRQRLPRLIGRYVRLHPSAHVTESVVGNGVLVGQPIRVEQSVILPETVVQQRENIVSCVVGPAGVVNC